MVVLLARYLAASCNIILLGFIKMKSKTISTIVSVCRRSKMLRIQIFIFLFLI